MAKIGILGGSFNPPHLGHLYLGECIKKEFGLDKVVFLPNGQPPHKTGLAGWQERKRMIELLIEGHSGLELWDMELKRNDTVYTVDTLTELSKTYKPEELYYLIGSDTLYVIDKWRNFKRVCELTQFICLNRPGDADPNIMGRAQYLKDEYGAVIYLSGYEGPNISSTEIREKAALHDTEGLREMLPKNVIEYIYENGIY